MNNLGFIEKLLDGVEVEWKALGEVCEFKNGFAFKSSLFRDTGLPIVRITNIDGKNVDLFDVKYFNPADYTSGNPLNYSIVKGDILIAMSGATTGKIGIFNLDVTAYLNQRVGKFEPHVKILNNRYLYHFLLTQNSFLYVLAGGGAQPNLSANNLKEKLKVPIPCPDNPKKSLEIQAEIVRILDAFTAMTAELTAELNLRQQQYNYYRDQLLSFEEGEVEWKTLGEVFNIFAGGDKPKDAFSEEETDEFNVPILSNGIDSKSLYGWTNSPKVTEPSLTVSARGTIGWTSYRDRPFFPIIRLIVLTPKIGVNTKYAYYYMKTIENNYPVPPAGIPQLTKPMIEKVQFPIPYPDDPEKSLEEQARIVAILDKFDALTNSITEGLPREIELRQKQYKYYRDLLLSFPKPEAG